MAADDAVLAAGDATLRIAPGLGGAWTALTWRGQPVLRPTPDDAAHAGNVRLTACYPLVPYSNRIRDAVLRVGTATHTLARNFGDHPHAIHGVGWQRAWHVERITATRVQLVLRHDPVDTASRAAWPWAFDAWHTVHLAGRAGGAAVLEATLTIASRADAAFPFGLGWHPFFPRDDATTLAFHATHAWRNDATQLPVERVIVPPEWDFARPRRLEADLDQVFMGWAGTVTIAQPARGHRVTLEADSACGRLVIYSPPGRTYCAVEPVTHDTDAFNRATDGAADTGTRMLAPGGAFSCTMRLTVAPLTSPPA